MFYEYCGINESQLLRKFLLFLAYKSFLAYFQDLKVKSTYNFVGILFAGNNCWSLLSTYLLCIDTSNQIYMCIKIHTHTYVWTCMCVRVCICTMLKLTKSKGLLLAPFYRWRKWGPDRFSYWNGKKSVLKWPVQEMSWQVIFKFIFNTPSNQCDPDVLPGSCFWETVMMTLKENG